MNASTTRASGDDVEHAMAGDREAFQLVTQRWYRKVYAHCQATLISRADAEDATQETFMRGYLRVNELRSPDAIGAWLRGIAHHVCVDLIRRKEVRKASSGVEDSAQSTENPSDQVARNDQQDHLIRLIHRLPESLREAICLHYYDEMTYDEIADWLGVARSTVNERLSKARQLLKRELLPESRSER